MTPKFITALCVGALAGVAALAQTPDTGYHRPVAAEILTNVDVHHYNPGSPVFVKLNTPWVGLGCYLFDGQVLQGRVEVATRRSKVQKESQLAISFPNAPCVESQTTLNLVLVAVEWDPGETSATNAQSPDDEHIGGGGLGSGSGQRNMKFDEVLLTALSAPKKNQIPLRAGDVVGLDHVTLEIGTGPERSSMLKSTKRDVHVEKESLLLLVPESIVFPKRHQVDEARLLKPPPIAGSRDPGQPTDGNIPVNPPPPPAPIEFEPCEPPACSVDLTSSDTEMHGAASKTIEISALGYTQRQKQMLGDLDNDVAVGWLGPQQLLVAFNPHTLIDRQGLWSTGKAVRKIHAVVLEPTTSKVLSSADWVLPDASEFLWQLSGGRVLVHVGNELRIYGQGMQLERQIPVDGPLQFVRLSPNGEQIAIAIVRETHTPEQHVDLRDSLGREPPENVEIRVLDKDFKTVAHATTSSKIIPPTLLNEGQVKLMVKANKYLLTLTPWNGEMKTVARFPSACLPEVTSFAPDLLMVSTCEPKSGSREYRVLRPSGKVVLRGRPDPQTMGHSAQGNGRYFAVRNLHASQAMAPGSPFQGSDLDYEIVRVFQSDDGRRLTSVRLQAPPPSHGAYALSPDGTQLAVIADAKVNLLAVPAQ